MDQGKENTNATNDEAIVQQWYMYTAVIYIWMKCDYDAQVHCINLKIWQIKRELFNMKISSLWRNQTGLKSLKESDDMILKIVDH